MTAQLVVMRNPFHPLKDRETYPVECGRTLADLAPKSGVFVIARNGEYVLRKDWQIPIGDNDLIAIVFLPRGGGGGSNPLKIVLSIAMAVIAPEISAYFFEEAVMAGTMSSLAFNAATAGFSMVGNTGINLLGVGT